MKRLSSIILLFSFISFTFAQGKYHETVFPTESNLIYDACLSADGKVIICTDNNTLKAFSMENKKQLADFTDGHSDKILCVDLSPDSTMLASGGRDSTVVIWNFITRRIIKQINFVSGKITCIKFSPDNQFLLFGSSGSQVYLYNIKEQKMVKEFTDQKMDVSSIDFSPDGNLIAIAGCDKIIRLYNTRGFRLTSELKAHTSWIRSIKFYNDGRNLISSGDDKKIIKWNLSKTDYKKANTHKGWILSLDIENNEMYKDNMYVYGTIDGWVKINYTYGYYEAKLNSPVSKVLLLPSNNHSVKMAVATLGSGLLQLDAVYMSTPK